MTTTLATGLPELDLEGEATMIVDANDANAVLTKVTIHLRAGAPHLPDPEPPLLTHEPQGIEV
jgi:hypothetical protein